MATQTFSVTHDGLTMQCRLFQRSGGYASGSWVLSGYINNEERMGCDVTATIKRHGNNRERLMRELTETAQLRLTDIARETAKD